ncbi:hypothetical protein N7450_010039 [Penicillium hetheringtonii]|uniref:Condensin complex subunit 1 n=1 Tax=Penicillium hetheringtonii TaxID=911720 RepID=A0AAD6DC14_9EURO|nr:hypothetical protein N7450_010039 [Penicillium hetheringtonii]
MEDRIQFDINDSLKYYLSDPTSIPTPDADPELLDCETDPDQLSTALIDNVLNPIVDAVAENPEGLTRSSFFDSLQFLLKCAPNPSVLSTGPFPSPGIDSERLNPCRYTSFLPTKSLSKVLDLVVSGLSVEADIIVGDLESDEQDAIQQHKQLLEMYGFLLQWALSAVEVKAAEKPAEAAPARRGGPKSKSKSAKDGAWDWTPQIQISMETMCKVMKLKLGRIFMTTSDRDTFINLFTRTIYLVLESEQRVKSMTIRMHAFKVLCIAVKHHGHAFGAQTSIVQNLTYFEHLSEPMAEFLHILAEQYDYPQLSDEILKELGNKEFNSNDTRGPKSVSAFIIKLSELAPRLIIKQMTLLAKQLDSEAYTLRCAVIEVCGNLISDLSRQEERSENYKTQINAFFDVLEERFLDVNPYCRCRAIQVFMRICDLEQKFPKRRQAAAELAARSLEDKSSNVRRNAIKLLSKLVATHPFAVMHGGLLSYKEWNERLDGVDSELNALRPPETPGFDGEMTQIDPELLDDATQLPDESPSKAPRMTEEEKATAMQKAAEQAATSELLTRLQLTRKYYNEAIRFIEVLHSGSAVVCQLLSSRNKSEVIEAMDFFVMLDAYKVETARTGIRRMLRLIWTKGNSDEGKGVQSHLIDCYKGLFFDAPDSFSPNDAATYIARNMISLTFGSTPAELTCLEQLLSTMMKAGHVSEGVIAKLWQVYGVQRKEISKTQRRGAIIVLGMLALADPEVVIKEIEVMLRIGLGGLGRSDLVLAKYTCIALRRMVPGRQAKSKDVGIPKLANDHSVLTKLGAMLEIGSESKEWYGVAEQAISAIYTLSKHPDVLCSDILRRKTRFVFQPHLQRPSSSHTTTSAEEQNSEAPAPAEDQQANSKPSSTALSQLLYVVGHIAIKQIVHLELCELDFKRRKAEQEKTKAAETAGQKNEDDDELDLIGGTTEDDFTDAMAHIRERELLYGEHSLLARFGPLVAEICANNMEYPNRDLQASATLCLAKLMCVSSEYCEKNLPLLITIMERSEDPIVRSNAVIALGDMAVSFNHLIDENTDFLYRRLNDDEASVKRTCLMTLTFLILAGQVKVKGQLGEMAKCLEDDDKKIADLARMFFTELATKDNAVYNHFVDMFSLLSAERNLEEASLRRIVKFLIGFVEKEKHARQLADKLAARLPRCETERQWNDVAYALSLLPHKNEEITKTVTAGFNKVVTAAA